MPNDKNSKLSAGEYKQLSPIARKIDALSKLLPKILDAETAFNDKRKKFFTQDNFPGKPVMYIILGFMGFAVLVFDIIIGVHTLSPLARYLGVPVLIFSVLFAVIDTLVAILASGILVSSPSGKFKFKKIFRTVLKLLGVIKLGLFLGFMIGHSNIDIPSIVMNSLFIIVIYTLFHFAGAGLLYIFGLVVYSVRAFFMMDSYKHKVAIDKFCKKFVQRCKDISVDIDTAYQEFKITKICD